MRTLQLRLDITEAQLTSSEATMAVSVHLPDADGLPGTIVFGYPGGGFARGYYDIRLPGDTSYSLAEYLTSRGVGVVACDHLGVGESSPIPDRHEQSIEALADANALTVDLVLRELDALNPGARPRLVGMGHSMGGCLLVVQQARHRSFDALVVLGWSSRHTAYPDARGGILDIRWPSRGQDPRRNPPERRFTREEKIFTYYQDDVPRDFVEADLATTDSDPAAATALRGSARMPWGSPTRPECAATLCSPGVIASEAAQIAVPVLLATGERDVVARPDLEPLAYPRVPEYSWVSIPRMSHMHNFAGSRLLLWEHLQGWLAAR
ncbi:alpha/beta hydrolase [Jatrophihabitans sp.]|uniref:alpha/beta hydrolase n=1 Tax=Jatrophihabitans sp. TaxID=1932789 RepID=UPI0030C6F924|nr:hypothetical protein [Jatrophihabitans sp.]